MELTVTAQANETAKDHMLRLGEMSRKVMAGRVKAMKQGLDAIHSALVEVSRQIAAEQSRLLTINPELVFMVME